jgi:hypothetical protein
LTLLMFCGSPEKLEFTSSTVKSLLDGLYIEHLKYVLVCGL